MPPSPAPGNADPCAFEQLFTPLVAQADTPLTLAIVSALQVDIAGAPFAIPLDRVERTLRLDPQMVRSVAGRRMLVLEDGVLPLLEGARTFGREPISEHELIVIVRGADRRLGLAVDDLVGQRELVTRRSPRLSPTASRSPAARSSPTPGSH